MPVEHSFDSTGEAYDASQTWDAIHDGDILIVPAENAVAVLIEAWPVAVSENAGEFHTPSDELDWTAIPTTASEWKETKDYSESFEKAVAALERLAQARAQKLWDAATKVINGDI